MRTAICDDEQIFISRISDLLKAEKEISGVCGYSNPASLIADIEDGRAFDLVFMDIFFEGDARNGIDYAEEICRLLPNVQVIFITGNNEYSQDIFQKKINLCGYLLKQVDPQKLDYLLKKAKQNVSETEKNSLIIVNKDASYVIPLQKLVYIESRGHMLLFHTDDKEISTYGKMDDYLSMLSANFLQCHKSYVVNMDEISRIEAYTIILKTNSSLPISRSKYKDSYKRFFSYMKSTM